MHTTQFDDERGTWYIQHNGDYSGVVKINLQLERENNTWLWEQEVEIPFEIIEQLVGYKVNGDLIGKLEGMDGKETLKFLVS